MNLRRVMFDGGESRKATDIVHDNGSWKEGTTT